MTRQFYAPAVPPFKYAHDLSQLPNCPPSTAVERTNIAFRFVWDPLTAASFVPIEFMPAKRNNRRPTKPSCSALGLSMFETEQQARTRFAELLEKNQEIRKSIGTHLAAVSLRKEDGRQTNPDMRGHFDLHEYHETNLVPQSRILGLL